MKKVIIIDTDYEIETHFDTDIETTIIKDNGAIISSSSVQHVDVTRELLTTCLA